MRTTIDIDDDLLSAIKEVAQQQKLTAGNVVSNLLREALRPRAYAPEYRNGVPLLPRRPAGPKVTIQLVNRLRNEDE